MDGFGAFYGKALERVMRCGPESKDLRDNVKFLANIKCFQYNQVFFPFPIEFMYLHFQSFRKNHKI